MRPKHLPRFLFGIFIRNFYLDFLFITIELITVFNVVEARKCFYRCLPVHRWGRECLADTPSPPGRHPPRGTHPPDQADPPRPSRHPTTRNPPPRPGRNPPGPGRHPPDQADTPPGPGKHPPPRIWPLQRTVRILLECILIKIITTVRAFAYANARTKVIIFCESRPSNCI